MIVKAVVLEPGKVSKITQVCTDQTMLKIELGVSSFEVIHPFRDKSIALVQGNDRFGEDLPFNRVLEFSDNGEGAEQVIQGKALIMKTNQTTFISLSDEEAQKYAEMFYYPEKFYFEDRQLVGVKCAPKEQKETISPSLLNEIWEGTYKPQQILQSDEYESRTRRFHKALQELFCILPEDMHSELNELLEAASSLFAYEKKSAFDRGIDFGRKMYNNETQ